MRHHMKMLLLAAAVLAPGAVLADSYGNQDSTGNDKFDIIVHPVTRNGVAASEFEWHPTMLPNKTCVYFTYGQSGQMQCFDTPMGAQTPPAN